MAFQRLLSRWLSPEGSFFWALQSKKKKRSVEASSRERSCYQAAQWLWFSILISVWVCVCVCMHEQVWLSRVFCLHLQPRVSTEQALRRFFPVLCASLCTWERTAGFPVQIAPVHYSHCDMKLSHWSWTHTSLHPVPAEATNPVTVRTSVRAPQTLQIVYCFHLPHTVEWCSGDVFF